MSVEPCTTHDLIDQPTRWLGAAQDAIADPDLLPALLERLLGAEPEHWSATEHARAAALAAVAEAARGTPRQGEDTAVEYDEVASGVLARIGVSVVGAAAFGPANADRVLGLTVEVAPAWRRLGIGTALLTRAVSLAGSRGAREILLIAPADDEGFVPMMVGAGLHARVKVSDGLLQARVTVASGVPAPG